MTKRTPHVAEPAAGRPIWSKFWDAVKDEKVGDLAAKFKQYAENVRDGADPIEAMSGHLCGPHCMHWKAMSEEQREKLKKAPWNDKEDE